MNSADIECRCWAALDPCALQVCGMGVDGASLGDLMRALMLILMLMVTLTHADPHVHADAHADATRYQVRPVIVVGGATFGLSLDRVEGQPSDR
jgi:hypothetical protein